MTDRICLATSNGIVMAERKAGGWHERRRALDGQAVTGVAARNGTLLAGSRRGVFRSDDSGRSWRESSAGLSTPYVRWLAIHPAQGGRAFAGTEPAGIFVSHDGGASWRECPEVVELRRSHGWFLPYSPGAGCVRGFAFDGPRGYAAVEVGGVLRTDDGGETWRLAEGSSGRPDFSGPAKSFVHPDVHSIALHPSSTDLVFAPTGGGFYRSRDGGRVWEDLYECYCRAVWADPEDAEHLILGPADDVDSDGRIEETRDGGKTWTAASAGLKVPWRRRMVERFTQAGDELIGVLSNGGLIASPLSKLEWREILPEVKDVHGVATVEA